MKIVEVQRVGRFIELTRTDGVTLKGSPTEYTSLEAQLLALPPMKTVYWYFGGLMEHPEMAWEVLCKGCGNTTQECVQDAINRGKLQDDNFLNVKNNTYWGCELAFGVFEFKRREY